MEARPGVITYTSDEVVLPWIPVNVIYASFQVFLVATIENGRLNLAMLIAACKSGRARGEVRKGRRSCDTRVRKKVPPGMNHRR